MEPSKIVQSLLQSASHRLVNLELTESTDTSGERIEEGDFMGSLQWFQVLKKIRVDYRMFGYGPRNSEAHRMISVLPVSVESVTLTGLVLSKKNSDSTGGVFSKAKGE